MAKRYRWNGEGGGIVAGGDDMFQGAHEVDTYPSATIPELALWQAVIARCWHDAYIAGDSFLRDSQRDTEPAHVRQEARRWLVSDLEPWIDDREAICALAGIDPVALRDFARRRLVLARNQDARAEQRRVARGRMDIDDAFERLLARADRMPKVAVSKALRELAVREIEHLEEVAS